jgi:hypothetical protein
MIPSSAPRAAVAALAVGLVLASCSGSSSPSASSGGETSSTTAAAAKAGWTKIDRRLSELAPKVGFLAARVAEDGTCRPVHAIAPAKARPAGSQFKLFVLGALARRIEAGRVSWDQDLPVPESLKSLGNTPDSGALGFAPPGTTYSVEEVATKMISISDNTAADMLIHLVGRDAVEQQMRRWSAHAAANVPFLTTREMFMLHYSPGLADQYLATPRNRREAFLTSSVDPLPLGAVATGFSLDPRFVETIEWFASPTDVCRALSGLQRLAERPRLRPLTAVLSREQGTIGLEPPEWRTVFFKGGSEPGVLTLGWLATTKRGETYVVQAMVTNPEAVLAPDAITDLVDIAHDAFDILHLR